jgi:methyl-accepting chemotaxis protein
MKILKNERLKESLKKKLKQKIIAERALKILSQENIDYQLKESKLEKEIKDIQDEMSNTTELSIDRQQKLDKIIGKLEEISVGSDGADESIKELATFIEEIASTTQENASTIAQINANVESIKNVTKILNEETRDSMDSVQSLLLQIDKVKKESGYIEDVIKLLENINSSIKLLSVNALIEAAHAKKAGKGFQVVADEIRELSDNTSLKVKKIKGNITNIINNIQESVLFSNDMKEKLLNIRNQTSETVNAVLEISSGMNEQSAVTQQISNNISSKVENIKIIEELIVDIKNQNIESLNKLKVA